MLPIIPDSYKDKDGLIGQQYAPGKLDFGDSCQRNFSVNCLMFFLGKATYRRFVTDLRLYASRDKANYYRRYRQSPIFINDWTSVDEFRLSRDQSTPLVIAMGLYESSARLKGFIKHNKFFATNTIMNWVNKEEHSFPLTKWERIKFYFGIKPKLANGGDLNAYTRKLPDLLSFERWAHYARGIGHWALYPIILLGDTETLLASALRNRNKNSDVLNHSLSVLYAGAVMRTFLWPLIKKANNLEDLSAKLRRYFNGPDPKELGELYILALKKYL